MEIVDNDRLLFVPPVTSDPVSLAWLPAGPSVVVTMRPARWFAAESLPLVQQTLGPDGTETFRSIAAAGGLPPQRIDRLVAGVYVARGRVRTLVRATTTEPINAPPTSWVTTDDPADRPSDNGDFTPVVYRLPDNDDIAIVQIAPDQFLCGPGELVRAATTTAGAPATLPPSIDRIATAMPADVDLGLLAGPNFFFTEGRPWLSRRIPDWTDDLRQFFIPDIAAFSITLHHAGDNLYVENRLMPAGNQTPIGLLQRTRSIVSRLPQIAATKTDSIIDDQPWYPLAAAFPNMLSFVADNLRSDIVDSVVVANTYLPATAASQITVAGWIVANAPVRPLETIVQQTVPETIASWLKVRLDVSIAQESLQLALSTIRDQITGLFPAGTSVPAMEILGGDLQLDGITQNQQIRDFKLSDQTLGDVLTALCVAANPDKTATGPSDPKQKLIWVARQNQIVLTTRAAAQKRGEVVPPVFVSD